jgi:hypothetical protein
MLRRVALVRTDFSERHSASIIRATRMGELGTRLTVTSSYEEILFIIVFLVTLIMEVLRSPELSVLTRAARRSIPEDDILQYSTTMYSANIAQNTQCSLYYIRCVKHTYNVYFNNVNKIGCGVLLQTFSFYADHKSVDAETWYHSPSSPF